jgi:hypothetical protein
MWNKLYMNDAALEGYVSLPLHDDVPYNWEQVSRTSHPSAIELLKANPKKICGGIELNEHSWAISYAIGERFRTHGIKVGKICKNSTDIVCDWIFAKDPASRTAYLSHDNIFANSNPRIIALLKDDIAHGGEISWKYLSQNSSDWALDLLLANPGRICTKRFNRNRNPRAIEFLHNNPELRDWDELSANPSIFELREPDGLFGVLSE